MLLDDCRELAQHTADQFVYDVASPTPHVSCAARCCVVLLPCADAPQPSELSSWLRAAAEGDREVMEKGSRAYVSLVRGYKEHHCKFVFRLQELPLGPLAASMGLLRLPRMPELKKGSAANALDVFVASAVEPDSANFRDRAREKQRQQVRAHGWVGRVPRHSHLYERTGTSTYIKGVHA